MGKQMQPAQFVRLVTTLRGRETVVFAQFGEGKRIPLHVLVELAIKGPKVVTGTVVIHDPATVTDFVLNFDLGKDGVYYVRHCPLGAADSLEPKQNVKALVAGGSFSWEPELFERPQVACVAKCYLLPTGDEETFDEQKAEPVMVLPNGKVVPLQLALQRPKLWEYTQKNAKGTLEVEGSEPGVVKGVILATTCNRGDKVIVTASLREPGSGDGKLGPEYGVSLSVLDGRLFKWVDCVYDPKTGSFDIRLPIYGRGKRGGEDGASKYGPNFLRKAEFRRIGRSGSDHFRNRNSGSGERRDSGKGKAKKGSGGSAPRAQYSSDSDASTGGTMAAALRDAGLVDAEGNSTLQQS